MAVGWFLAATLVAALTSCQAQTAAQQRATYCAIMPDSVGLYVGNPVTQMGYRIGDVTSITPSARSVRVDFTVNEQRTLPHDVRALIRSRSILADRSLELVGNFAGGPTLTAGQCIPLSRSSTPKSLSAIVGSSTELLNAINPEDSRNIGDVVKSLDQALRTEGPDVNKLLTKASALLDSPDQAIGDLGSIVKNMALLTRTFSGMRGNVKQLLYDLDESLPYAATALWGGVKLFHGQIPLMAMTSDIEVELGGEIQQTLDSVSVVIRKLTPRAPFYANLLTPVPGWINWVANVANNHQFNTIRYRPPLYRVRTPDGVATCNRLNASMPGSCANVNGMPYAIDVALLQLVLTQASR
nr:MlaD family protein [Mycobacterium vicinigordonae]